MVRTTDCAILLAALVITQPACSSDDAGSANGGSAGNVASGGGFGNGGATSSGGSGNGGVTSSGGSANSGGTAGGGAGGSGASSTAHDCNNPGPGWLFCEDFEGMASGFDAWKASWGWTDQIGAGDPGRMTASPDAHTGSWAVHYPAAESAGYRGADLIFRTCAGANKPGCALESHEQLYFRTYLKLAADHQRMSHFLAIGGSQQFWDSYGNAGCRPNGYRSMGTTVDFDKISHNTFFYTYFPTMKCDSGATCDKYADAQKICSGCAEKDMPCSNGPECCWGNHFRPDPNVALPVDQWVCFEMMMKANDVGQSNGEMAYWIDGQLAHQVTTMQWRTTTDLGLNKVRLQHYVTTAGAQNHSNRVWFDDVVVSTERIGGM
jgi:hypothetical protein